MDLVTPPRQLEAGRALYALNYECPVTGGFRRIDGYEQLGDEVPGEGPVLGVCTFADEHYAIRKDVGEDEATLYRYDDGSWEVVAGGLHVGRYEFAEGNLYATEGFRSLFFVGGGKPYQLMADAPPPPSHATLSELLASLLGTLPQLVSLTADGDQLTITDDLGRAITDYEVFDFQNTSLLTEGDVPAGEEGTELVSDMSSLDYNDVGMLAFKVGSTQVELTAPQAIPEFREISDAMAGAKYIALHSGHLFLGFEPGSVQFSSIGDPANWNASTGSAGEIGVGQTITGLVNGRGGTLHIMCRDSVQTLYGTSAMNFELRVTIPKSGAKAYSTQALINPYYVAERGISNLEASDQFGDFRPMQPGAAIEPVFAQQGYADRINCSQVSKRLAQYRVFFDDGLGVYLSPAGITLVQYPDVPIVAHGGELDSGEEVLLFGTDDGLVMMQGGGTFNGEIIPAFLTLAYNDLGRPAMRKRFRRVFWDIRSGSGATIRVTPDFDFGNVESARHSVRFLTSLLGGGLWDVDDWNDFAWSAPVQSQDALDIAGTGTSINFSIYSEASEPHELLGYDLVLTPRRLRRG